MYDELVKRLREEASSRCINCCYLAGDCVCAAPDDRKKDCDNCSKLQAADAIEELSKQLDDMNEANIALYGALPKWIPVTERLPDENDRYLTVAIEPWFGTTIVDTMRWSGVWMYDGRQTEATITHWMPLPEPPKEE